MTTLIDLLRASAAAHPDRPAILTDGLTIDQRHFDGLSDRIAAGLVAYGIQPGDRIALYAPNSPEFPLVYVGILKAGATVVPINLLIHAREIAYILKDAGVRAVVVHRSLLDRFEAIDTECPDPPARYIIDTDGDPEQTLAALLAPASPVPIVSFDPTEHLAAILYTSGTTGFPKGAMLTHANLVANVRSVHQAMKWRAGLDRVLVVLPMFHAFAATVGMLTPLTFGCALIPLARFEPDLVAQAIHSHAATIFLGVPSMYGVLLRLRDDRVGCLASLRFGVVGGAAMPVAVLQQFEARFGVRLYEGDGPTECSPVTCVNPIDGLAKPGTVGLPVPDVEMRIVDEAGLTLPDGEVGEIAVRGPNVMKGYWGQPEATAEVMRDGWLLTGDLGTRDADGYFSIVDRKKDLIIVNGMNVYPRMIEEVLYAYPGVREVAVIGEPHALHGEIPVAYVALADGAEASEAALRDFCRARLGRHQVPRRFEVLDELPKNAAGKILKRQLRKQGEIERGIQGLETAD